VELDLFARTRKLGDVMARNLARALKSDLSVRDLTEILRRKGRRGDTVLAHITPREMAILKKHGGSGTINPETGLPEFFGEDISFSDTFNFDTSNPNVFNYTPDVNYSPSGAQMPQQSGYTASNVQPITTTGVGSPQNADQQAMMTDYIAQVNSGEAAPGQTLWNSPATPYDPNYVGAAWGFQPTNSFQSYVPLGTNLVDTASTSPGIGQALVNAQSGAPPADALGQTQQTAQTPAQAGDTNAPGSQTAAAKPGLQGILDKIDPFKLALALGGAGLGMYGASQAKSQGAKQAAAINALGQQQSALAQPFLTQGGQLYGQAVQGNLNATNRQAFDAARAQLAQSAANTGGVGAMQATALAENMRQQALQTQLNQGLQLLGQGDALMNSALATQLQAINAQGQYAQQASAAATNFFGALGKIYGSTV